MTPDRPRPLAERIGEAVRFGRLEEAAALLETYAHDRPHRADEQFLLACIWANLGFISAALTWLNRVVVLKPQHGEAQLRLGRSLMKLAREREAEGALRRALALAPSRAQPLLALGACLNRLKRWAEAEPLLSRACAARPNDPLAHYELGLALMALGQTGASVRRLTQAATLDPGWAVSRLAQARALYELGQVTDAVSHVEAAADLDPTEFGSWLLMGSIDFARNCLAQSCRNFWRVIAFHPGLAEGHFLLGRSLAESRLNVEAAAAFALAAILRPGWAEAHHARGMVLLRRDQKGDAATSLAAAAAANPQWAVPRFQLANVLLDLQGAMAAAANYAAAACLDPDTFGRHLARAPLSAAVEGPIASLEAYARAKGMPSLALPREVRDDPLSFACIAVGLDRAKVIGSHPLILTEDGTMLAGGIGYNPSFTCDQISNLNHGWYVCGRNRYALAAPTVDEALGAHLYLGAYHNFGHWLYNNLSRLAYVEQHPELRRLPLAMPDTVSADRRELFALVGYGADRITLFKADAITRFERLWVPATLWQQPPRSDDHGMTAAIGRTLSALARKVDPNPGVLNRLIYIPRGKVTRRRVSNESEVMTSLAGRGFEILDASALSIIEQIRLVRRARVIAAPMGAATAITTFAQAGTLVIVCKVEGAAMDIIPFLCATNGLRHVAVRCTRAHVHTRALFDDFVIPMAELDRAIDQATDPRAR